MYMCVCRVSVSMYARMLHAYWGRSECGSCSAQSSWEAGQTRGDKGHSWEVKGDRVLTLSQHMN